MDVNNTEALRRWLMACPVIEAGGGIFGADYLQDAPGGWTLDNVPSALRYRENIVGEMVLLPRQEQLYVLAARMDYGADAGTNLGNLAAFQQIHAWILAQNNARDFPAWEGGAVTAIVPTVTAYPIAFGVDAARYQMQIRVSYRVGA